MSAPVAIAVTVTPTAALPSALPMPGPRVARAGGAPKLANAPKNSRSPSKKSGPASKPLSSSSIGAGMPRRRRYLRGSRYRCPRRPQSLAVRLVALAAAV